MALSFDVLLLYYDNPVTLRNWLCRLLHHTDYLEYADRSEVILADTGTPLDRIEATLDVLREFKPLKPAIYLRSNTEEIRSLLPESVEVRPSSVALNACWRDISQADLLVHAVVSNVYVPHYFGETLARHEANPRLVLQPKQFCLQSETYHQHYYDRPFPEVLSSGPIKPWNGLPDFSMRREHMAQIGGWDEDYIAWGMCDLDLCARLTGRIDLGTPVEDYFVQVFGYPPPFPYAHLGLDYERPHSPEFFSLICNEYPGRLPLRSPPRELAAQLMMRMFFERWGVLYRNQQRKTVSYKVYSDY